MLVNHELANKKVATEFGQVTFNEKGECNELTAEQQKKLGKLKGFKHVAEKVEAKPVEAKPVEAKPAAAKKTTAKKATATKAKAQKSKATEA